MSLSTILYTANSNLQREVEQREQLLERFTQLLNKEQALLDEWQNQKTTVKNNTSERKR